MSARDESTDKIIETVENGLLALRVRNRFGSLLVYRQGAQVVDYTPAGGAPVLFVSRASRLERKKAIRGGVPICFPWFGPHEERKELPAHGFARTSEFEYLGGATSASGEVSLRFGLKAGPATRESFPYDFEAHYEVRLGENLTLVFTVRNTGNVPFTFEAALHTYFAVSDVRQVEVTGLTGESYLDQLSGRVEQEAERAVRISREVDRIYTSRATCHLVDPGLDREIVVSKQGSASTVVWNPWIEKSQRLADLGDDEYLRMLCIESANVRPETIELFPSEAHALQVSIASERLDAERRAG